MSCESGGRDRLGPGGVLHYGVRRGCAPVLCSFWPENSGIGIYFHLEFSGIGVYCYTQILVLGAE